MLTKEYKVEEISYERKEDRRIIEAVLRNWFKNPKVLNLAAPNLKYPFNFKEWLKFYSSSYSKAFILKKDNWIIGHIGIEQDLRLNSIHLFHLLIDINFQRLGLGSNLILKSELIAKNLNVKLISLNVLLSNKPAINLYKKLEYNKNSEKSKKKYVRFEKKF